MTIYEFINKFKIKGRDKLVKQAIQQYLSNQVPAVNDGIYKDFLVFGNSFNTKLLEIYGVDKKEFDAFKKTNKIMSQDYQIANDIVKLGLITSYVDTGDLFFVDIIGQMYSGSKFSHFFPYRDSAAYEARMRHTIEYELNRSATIVKEGTMYGAVNRIVENMFESSAIKPYSTTLKTKDKSYIYILGRIRTSVTFMIKSIKNAFENSKDKEKLVHISKDIITEDDNVLEVKNDMTFINSLMFVVNNYSSKDYDIKALRIAGLIEREYKFFTIELLRDDADWFKKYADIYIKYYVDKYYTNKDDFKVNFIFKASTAKMNSAEMKKLDDLIIKKIYKLKDKYIETFDEKPEQIINLRATESYIKKFKNYIILKIRILSNDI